MNGVENGDVGTGLNGILVGYEKRLLSKEDVGNDHRGMTRVASTDQ